MDHGIFSEIGGNDTFRFWRIFLWNKKCHKIVMRMDIFFIRYKSVASVIAIFHENETLLIVASPRLLYYR